MKPLALLLKCLRLMLGLLAIALQGGRDKSRPPKASDRAGMSDWR